MSEKSLQETSYVQPEIASSGELPPRDDAIDAVRNEINNLRDEIQTVEDRAATPGFKATANDLIESKMALRDIRATSVPRLSGLEEMWNAYGGNDIDEAQRAVEGLNFQSDASDHVVAKTRLRDAKDAFYGKLQESMSEGQEESVDNSGPDNSDADRLVSLKEIEPKGSELGTSDAERLEALKAINPVPSELSDTTNEAKKLEALKNVEPQGSNLENATDINATSQFEALRDTDPAPSELDGPEGEAKRLPWHKRAYYRAGVLYQNGLDKVFGSDGDGDSQEKQKGTKKMRNIALGAITLIGVGLAAKYAYDSGFLGGGSHINPNHLNDVAPAPSAPSHPPVAPPTINHEIFSDAARMVNPSEGWYQTMTEAGITDPAKQANILHNDTIMQRLADMKLAYKAPELGGWGMNMPANGALPQEALDILTGAAK